MNFRRKISRRCPWRFEPVGKLASRAMMYQCETCGKAWRMYVQLGLCEGGENHKPVPFAIACKYCNGVAYHAMKDIRFDKPVPILGGMDYFANIEGRDCGIPQYAKREE